MIRKKLNLIKVPHPKTIFAEYSTEVFTKKIIIRNQTSEFFFIEDAFGFLITYLSRFMFLKLQKA